MIVTASLLLIAVILFAGGIWYELSPRRMCGSHGSYTSVSPDGAHRAVLYEFDCGATIDFGTHLAVESTKRKFDPFDADEDSLVFTANSNHGRASIDGNGILHIDVRWVDSSNLVVYVPSGAHVFKRETKSGLVSIQYETAQP